MTSRSYERMSAFPPIADHIGTWLRAVVGAFMMRQTN